jgi:membrane fusion protein, multidrug efflux system
VGFPTFDLRTARLGAAARIRATRLRAIIIVVAGLGLAGLAALGWRFAAPADADKPPAAPPAVPVEAAVVAAKNVPALLPALGTVLSVDTVNVMPQVNGRITKIYFKQGDEVAAGQKLFEIDQRPYQAALTQAQGQLARDQAALAEAKMDLSRYQNLLTQNSIAKQTPQDQAQVVAQDIGTVELDQGNVATATLNLSYCQIDAPVAGKTGALQVDLGNYVQAASSAQSASASQSSSAAPSSPGGAASTGGGPVPLVSITQMHPIFVSFSVPQSQLDTIRQNQAKAPLTVEAYTQAGKLIAIGQLTLINNQVNAATGTVMLEATFANQREQLWPNQFVAVRLIEFMRQNALTVPSTAIMTGPNGAYVSVVGAGNKVSRVTVQVAATQDNLAVISKGLRAGQQVVAAGQYNLDNGTLVSTRAPSAPSPAPAAG